MSEIELKFLVDEPAAKRLWARAREAKLASGKPTTKTLRSVYLDTPDHALKEAGIALRLRRDGRRWMQTVKTARQIHGGLSQSAELECPAPGGRINLNAISDQSVRDEITRHLNGSALEPVCETLIRRTAGTLTLDDGTRAELAIDAGEIRAGGRTASLSEAEIELVEGSPAKLFDIAQALFPEGGLRFSRLSKSARGYLLAEAGHIEPPLAPRNAEIVELVADQIGRARGARRAARMRRPDRSQHGGGAVSRRSRGPASVARRPAAPAQCVRGLRRSAGQPRDGAPERRGDVARTGGRCAARPRRRRQRDRPARGADPSRRAALKGLADLLGKAATERRERLCGLLAGARAQKLILDLVRFVETRGWLVPEDFEQTARLAATVAGLAEAALDKAWKKAKKRARGIETLDSEHRHELRKELKKLRYAVEFLGPLYQAKRIEPFLKRLKKLQDVFGELNDAATVRTMFAGDDAPLAGDTGAQRAIGWLIGAAQARAEHGWTGAKALWKELEDTRPFWK